MARIATVSVDRAEDLQLQLLQKSKSLYGGVLPGIRQILLFDPDLAVPASQMYQHLNLRKDSPLTRLQREMVAAVVNGLIGGAP
ncbi:MAG: hypothetical protein HYY01_06075 [Chloroflexi bacterium]|nr:hypothetical protein [candidate division NC10 bacterium]MBI2456368.1 hypothetical protein [candidate division NC10 bacterium]MBI2917546.1 hypothetical protein [Chloroflexota bacterium]MBI3121726.1 hypothetical protein [candidate division NC10 bacterium]